MKIKMKIDGLQCDSSDDKVNIELDLDDDTIKLLEQMAADRGVSVDELVEEALTAAMDKFDETLLGDEKL